MFDKDKNSQFSPMVIILLVMCFFIGPKSVRVLLSRLNQGSDRRHLLRAASEVPDRQGVVSDLDELPYCVEVPAKAPVIAGDDRAEAKTVGSSDKDKKATDAGKGVDTGSVPVRSVPEKRNHGSMESQSIWLLFLKYVTYPLRMLLFSVYMMFRGAAFILFDDRGSYRPAHSGYFKGVEPCVATPKSGADSCSSILKI